MKDYKLGLHVCIVAQPLSPRPSTVAKRLHLPRARGKRARERARTRREPVPIYRSKKPAFASCARGKRARERPPKRDRTERLPLRLLWLGFGTYACTCLDMLTGLSCRMPPLGKEILRQIITIHFSCEFQNTIFLCAYPFDA